MSHVTPFAINAAWELMLLNRLVLCLLEGFDTQYRVSLRPRDHSECIIIIVVIVNCSFEFVGLSYGSITAKVIFKTSEHLRVLFNTHCYHKGHSFSITTRIN